MTYVKGIQHVGIAVTDMDKSLSFTESCLVLTFRFSMQSLLLL